MEVTRPKLEWKAAYSVDVALIDQQHQRMFAVINELIDAMSDRPTKERLEQIIQNLLEYKKVHFATEEGYFKKFQFEGAEEHIAQHAMFGEKIAEIQKRCADDVLSFTFELVDFLEDWLIGHLMNVDQKYKACFKAHGLR